MKIKQISAIMTVVVAGLLTFATGCEKIDNPEVVSEMALAVDESSFFDATISTKATPINTQNEFNSTYAAGVGVYSFIPGSNNAKKFENLKVSYVNSNWQMARSYKWAYNRDGVMVMDFYGFAPYGAGISGLSFNHTNKSVSFNYTLADEDLMAGFYSGTGAESGDTRTATMKFSHVLSAVKFVVGDIEPMTINSISIDNVYKSGKCTADFETTGYTCSTTWGTLTGSGKVEKELSKTFSSKPSSGTAITTAAQTYMLIPQTCGSSAAVTVKATVGGQARTCSSSIKNIKWEPGKIYTYKIDIIGMKLTLTMLDWNWISETINYDNVVQRDRQLNLEVQNGSKDVSTYKIIVNGNGNVTGTFKLNSPIGSEYSVTMAGDFDAFDISYQTSRVISADVTPKFVITPKTGLPRDRDYQISLKIGLRLANGSGVNIDNVIQDADESKRFSIVLPKEN
jgi:hypothetical protein